MMSIEAMKQALEALVEVTGWTWTGPMRVMDEVEDAITALRKAIAEAEKQEPVAWVDLLEEAQQIVESKFLWKRFIDGTPLANDIACWMADFAQQHIHPQPKREWVGLNGDEVNECAAGCHLGNSVQGAIRKAESLLSEKNKNLINDKEREFVYLTLEEINSLWDWVHYSHNEAPLTPVKFTQAIEAKLKAKNFAEEKNT